MTTTEERISRLETKREHLATKADLKDLEVRLTKQMKELAMWMAGIMLAGMSVGMGIAAAVAKVIGN